MKRIFTLLTFLMFSSLLFAQEVNNIVTRQVGEKIEISYEITNSTSNQLFFVSIYCAIDGKDKIQLTSVTGDVGDNIKGGQSQYLIVWDVLKDVDELNSAEFFVKIELKEDGSKLQTITPLGQKKWTLGYNGSFYLPFGARLSYLDKWGGYFGFRLGNAWNYSGGWVDTYRYSSYNQYSEGSYWDGELIDSSFPYGDEDYSEFGFSLNLGAIKRIINRPKFQFYGYAGFGYGYWGTYSQEIHDIDYDYWQQDQNHPDAYFNTDNDETGYHVHVSDYKYLWKVKGGIEWQLGFYTVYKRLSFHLGYTQCYDIDLVFGLGYKF